ncbi:uncharacterized protein LOC111084943 [Limulus polyphemus]|uniref:Uncharacterized protein LOC111084943 n=1 Tax=Limulus polyphemus TaxID=6850 RepID=A0ABM1S127_LIMPO|nr:uncharacterized protein LOC111084943 [Limulus polyphemus]
MRRASLWTIWPSLLLLILALRSSRAGHSTVDLSGTRTNLPSSVRHQQERRSHQPFLGPWQSEQVSDPWFPYTNGYRQRRKSNDKLFIRDRRESRQYDVPQIECPPAEDGTDRFACPTPDRMSRYRCIDDHELCDGFIDCPQGEDEDRQACMFYKTTKAHLDVLADALLRWARGRF